MTIFTFSTVKSSHIISYDFFDSLIYRGEEGIPDRTGMFSQEGAGQAIRPAGGAVSGAGMPLSLSEVKS